MKKLFERIVYNFEKLNEFEIKLKGIGAITTISIWLFVTLLIIVNLIKLASSIMQGF